MTGVATIVLEQDCDNCGWHCDKLWFFAIIVVGVATIVVDCDNCEHCDNCDHVKGRIELLIQPKTWIVTSYNEV